MLKRFNSDGIRNCFATELAVIVAWVAVFIPGHLYGWLIERSYSALLLVVAIVSLIVRSHAFYTNFLGRRNKLLLSGLLVMTALYFFTTLLTITVSDYVLTIRDFLDLPRYVVIGAILVIMGNANPVRLRAAAEKLMIVSLAFSLVVLFLYLVDVPLLSDMIRWLYEDTKTGISFPSRVRLSAPFENPNYLAFYTVLCFAYALFFASGKLRLVLTVLVLFVLVSTGSRSGWVAALLLIAGLSFRVLFGVLNIRRSMLWQDVRFLILFVLAVSCLLWLFYPYLLESSRVQMVLRALEEGGLSQERNVAGRLNMIAGAFGLFVERPMLGWGTLKGVGLGVIDNQYFLLLARHGLIGFVLIISIMLYVFSGAIKFANTRPDKYGVVFMWFAVALLLMTGAFLNNFRLFTLFIFFVVAFTGKRVVNNQELLFVRHFHQNCLEVK